MSAIPSGLPANLRQVLGMAPPIGLELEWLSTTTFRVRSGSCYTRDGMTYLSLAVNATVDIATNGASGMDRKTLTGTVSGTSGTKAITGVGTAFLTDFGRRALTGTFANGGGTTTITATSGDPIGDAPMIGDLIGNDAIGYERVTLRDYAAIGSYTLTVANAHASFSGSTLYVIETPTFTVTGDATQHTVDRIASDTALTLLDNLGASPAGAAAYTGTRYPYRMYTVWLCSDGACYVSTRWDAPLNGLAGRIIGLLPLAASGNINGKSMARRDGWLCRVLLNPPSASSWNGTSETRLQEVATSTQPVRKPRRWDAFISFSLTSAAANASSPGVVLYPQTGVSGIRTYTGVCGEVDNAETGASVSAIARIDDIVGDGSTYGILFYNAGSGGTISASFRRDAVEVLL